MAEGNAPRISASCMQCVKPSPVLNGDDIQRGDHLIYHEHLYDHHAIVVSVEPTRDDPTKRKKCTVTLIHAASTKPNKHKSGRSMGLASPGRKFKLMKQEEEIDLSKPKHNVMVIKYMHHPFTQEEIVERAEKKQEESDDKHKFKYSLLKNNCEHFATWCVTDEEISVQASKFGMTMKMFWSIGQRLGSESARNEEAFKRGMLCEPCYKYNKTIVGVPKRAIFKKEDVTTGDSITYKYYKLEHDAVVMEINESNTEKMVVTVAHYAFCGPFTSRKIKTERINIRFDGSVKVTDYSQHNTYPPEEVVKRAERRLGEQLFAFFSNDSCHFARWCKLNCMSVVPVKSTGISETYTNSCEDVK